MPLVKAWAKGFRQRHPLWAGNIRFKAKNISALPIQSRAKALGFLGTHFYKQELLPLSGLFFPNFIAQAAIANSTALKAFLHPHSGIFASVERYPGEAFRCLQIGFPAHLLRPPRCRRRAGLRRSSGTLSCSARRTPQSSGRLRLEP